jgi:hypothetical protein
MDALMEEDEYCVRDTRWRVDGKVESNKVPVSKAIRMFFLG